MESIKKNRAGRITGAVLRANHKYHLQRPFIEKLVFKFYPSEIHLNRALAKKEIDGTSAIAPYRAPQLALQHNKKLETLDLTRFFLIFINTDNQILKEKNVRLALAYATNKQEIVSTVLRGQGIVVDSPILPKFFHFNSDIKRYPFNPQLAQDILEKSGWRNTEKGVREKDGTPLKLSLVTSNLEEFKLVTELLKSQWEDVGFAVTVQMVSLPELQRNHIQERNFDLLLFGEVLTIIPDPFSFWHSSQKHDPGLNIAVYENRKADALLEEARQTIDPIARARMYDDFQQIVIEDLPAIFLYSAHLPYLLPKKIKGVAHMRISLPSERFANIEQWYIKTKRAKKK